MNAELAKLAYSVWAVSPHQFSIQSDSQLEPDELPDCSIPRRTRQYSGKHRDRATPILAGMGQPERGWQAA